MVDARTLYEIPLYRMETSNNWMSAHVHALDDETFTILGGRGERKVFRDVELKHEKNGKCIINIEYLDLKFFYPNVDLPKEFEMPLEILEARKEKRRLNALAKGTLFVDHSVDPIRYYYLESEELRVLQGKNEITSKTIEIKYGRRAINAKGLKLGHQFLELPTEVAQQFESVLKAQELKNVKLILVGTSTLDGKKYHRLTVPLPEEQWDIVKTHFVFFEGNDELQGWLTCEPGEVAEILNIETVEGL